MLLFQLSSIVIFIVTALLNLLIACQLPSHSFTTQCFLLVFVPIMSTLLMPKLISICPLSPLLLVNSGTLLVDSVFHFPLTWPALREEYKDTFRAKLTILREISSSYFMSSVWVRSSNFVAFAWDSEMSKKKKTVTIIITILSSFVTLKIGEFGVMVLTGEEWMQFGNAGIWTLQDIQWALSIKKCLNEPWHKSIILWYYKIHLYFSSLKKHVLVSLTIFFYLFS